MSLVMAGATNKPFRVQCNAAEFGALDVSGERASVICGQTILRNGVQELWDFVLVLANRTEDGTLTTRVLLCHPDWPEPQEIVSIHSNPQTISVRIAESHSFAR